MPRGKESTKVRKSQIKGKESENAYQELKRSQNDRHTQTHGNCIEIFRLAWPSFSIEREFVNTGCSLCRVFTNIYSLSIEKDSRASRNISIHFPCVCVCLSLLWSLQFLVRLFFIISPFQVFLLSLNINRKIYILNQILSNTFNNFLLNDI